MAYDSLRLGEVPSLSGGKMLLAFHGWMDGGDVSTGTVESLVKLTGAREFATVDPGPFYILNFPGSMEIATLFRPHVEYDQGVIRSMDMPEVKFWCRPERNLAFFVGKEPNLRWEDFADCIFQAAKVSGIRTLLFIGSFAGAVPHTREPRLYGAVSCESLRPMLAQFGLKPTEYEGPASFATYLLYRAKAQGFQMLNVSVEIPSYLEGINPRCIEAVTRRLAKIVEVEVNLAALRTTSDEWEEQVNDAVDKDKKLADMVQRLEEHYDEDLIDESKSG